MMPAGAESAKEAEDSEEDMASGKLALSDFNSSGSGETASLPCGADG